MKRIAALLSLLAFSLAAPAREIVDMAGRHVQIPDKIERLYAPSPYGGFLMYALAPDLMVGRVMSSTVSNENLLPPQLQKLPVLGATNGSLNPEALLKAAPQVLVIWDVNRTAYDDRMNAKVESLGLPYVFVYGNEMSDYPAVIRFLGQLTGRTARAEALARYAETTLGKIDAAVRQTPPAARPRVYYAYGADGLTTDCADSFHTSLLRTLGDVNIRRCKAVNGAWEKISLEELILAQPDVILAQDRGFVEKSLHSPAWREVKAVREGRVYLIPRQPLNWMDLPPSVMRFLGAQWLANILYPKAYPLDIVKTTQDFYRLFFGVKLSAAEARAILKP